MTMTKRELLLSIANMLSDRLGIDLGVTSHIRGDFTAHRRGVAMDLAPRSGVWYKRREHGKCPDLYNDYGFVSAVQDAAEAVNDAEPRLRKVLVEIDHLHIEVGPPGPVKVGIYAPAVRNSLCVVHAGTEEPIWLTT